MPLPWPDPAELDEPWDSRVAVDPVGSRLRTALPQRWVRFHTLPDGRRIAADDSDRAEILRRYVAVLAAVAVGESPLLVLTSGWGTSDPAPREPELARLLPGTLWRTWPARAVTDGRPDPVTSVYATAIDAGADDGPLAELLIDWVATDRTADVIITPAHCRWLVAPYDGGIDVIAADPAERDQLAARFATWRSPRPDGL